MYLDNETVLESGNYRVKVMNDYDPLLPDGDLYAPQFMVPITNRQRADILLNIDQETATYLTEVFSQFDYDVDTFNRWARIFHDTNARVFDTAGYSQGDYAFIIVWPTQEWLETVGLDSSYTPTETDISDLASYLWGDVFVLDLQVYTEWFNHKGDVMATYETVDSIGGIYVNHGQGDEYVKDMAQELLESNIA